MSNNAVSPGPHSATGQSSPSVYFGMSRRGSLTSLAGRWNITIQTNIMLNKFKQAKKPSGSHLNSSYTHGTHLNSSYTHGTHLSSSFTQVLIHMEHI